VCKLELIVEERRAHFAKNALKLWLSSLELNCKLSGSSKVRPHPGREILVLSLFYFLFSGKSEARNTTKKIF